jgi:hypothetical protein
MISFVLSDITTTLRTIIPRNLSCANSIASLLVSKRFLFFGFLWFLYTNTENPVLYAIFYLFWWFWFLDSGQLIGVEQ